MYRYKYPNWFYVLYVNTLTIVNHSHPPSSLLTTLHFSTPHKSPPSPPIRPPYRTTHSLTNQPNLLNPASSPPEKPPPSLHHPTTRLPNRTSRPQPQNPTLLPTPTPHTVKNRYPVVAKHLACEAPSIGYWEVSFAMEEKGFEEVEEGWKNGCNPHFDNRERCTKEKFPSSNTER